MTRNGRVSGVVIVALLVLAGCKPAVSEADDLVRAGAQLVERLGLTKASTPIVEDWLVATKGRTGLTFTTIVGKVEALHPSILRQSPIESRAAQFASSNAGLSQNKQVIEDVFKGVLCDTASLIAQGKAVDPSAIVSSSMKSFAGTLSQRFELILLRVELEQEVGNFARAKTSAEESAITDEMSYTIACFLLGKVRPS